MKPPTFAMRLARWLAPLNWRWFVFMSVAWALMPLASPNVRRLPWGDTFFVFICGASAVANLFTAIDRRPRKS